LTYHISGSDMDERWKGSLGEDNLWDFLKNEIFNPNEKCYVGCSINGDGHSGKHNILVNHAYGVLRIQEFQFKGKTHRLVQIRNPWGSGVEWDGDWGDQDPTWKELDKSIKKLLDYSEADDGTWWMNISDFKNAFEEIQVCRLLNQLPHWTHHVVNSKWEGLTAGGTEAIHLNPQFQLVLQKDATVFIELRQPSRRPLGKQQYDVAIGPVILKNCELGKRKLVFRPEDVVDELKLSHSRSRVVEVDLKASEGPFNIIAVAGLKGFESNFFLEVYTRDGDKNCRACASLRGSHTHSQLLPLADGGLPRCNQCNGVLEEMFFKVDDCHVHKQCYETFRVGTAPKCLKCMGPVCRIEGEYSGKYYAVNTESGEEKVHLECWIDYQIGAAPRCFQCQQGVFKLDGKFTGVYYEINVGQKIHEECWEAYRVSIAEKCLQCSQAVARQQGRFTGKFFMVENGKVHDECWDQYRQDNSPPCVHCSQPCCEIKDHFSGMFYELEEDKKCHVECFDAYSSSVDKA